MVAGVDVSGRTVGRTALAWLAGLPGGQPRLRDRPREEGLNRTHGDRNLIDALSEGRPQVVALDAPLALPHPVTCVEPSCGICFPASGPAPSYGRRQLEEPKRWRELSPGMKGPMPSAMIAAIGYRAIYLRRAIQREGFAVIETWPMGVYRMLAPEPVGSTSAPTLDDAARRAILAKVVAGLDGSEAGAWSRDQLDAVAAAYAAWCWAENTAHAVTGLAGEGEIWVPTASAAA